MTGLFLRQTEGQEKIESSLWKVRPLPRRAAYGLGCELTLAAMSCRSPKAAIRQLISCTIDNTIGPPTTPQEAQSVFSLKRGDLRPSGRVRSACTSIRR
jgi:hypothetical protein